MFRNGNRINFVNLCADLSQRKKTAVAISVRAKSILHVDQRGI